MGMSPIDSDICIYSAELSSAVWGSLVGTAFLEETHHWRQDVKFQKPGTIPSFFSWLPAYV